MMSDGTTPYATKLAGWAQGRSSSETEPPRPWGFRAPRERQWCPLCVRVMLKSRMFCT